MFSLPFNGGTGARTMKKLVGKRGLTGLFDRLAMKCRSSVSFGGLPVPFTYISRGVMGNGRMGFRGNMLTATVQTDVTVPKMFAPIQLSDVILISKNIMGGCPMGMTHTVKTSVVVKISIRGSLGPTGRLGDANDVLKRLVGLVKLRLCGGGLGRASACVGISIRKCSTTDFAPDTISALVHQKRRTTLTRGGSLVGLGRRLKLSDACVPGPLPDCPCSPGHGICVGRVAFSKLSRGSGQ